MENKMNNLQLKKELKAFITKRNTAQSKRNWKENNKPMVSQ